jgi:hypothetical protein
MKNAILLVLFTTAACAVANDSGTKTPPPKNKLIDYSGFLKDAKKVGELREQRRVTELEFMQMAGEPGTIILDARTKDKFDMLHIDGARHLALTDVTEAELAKVIPGKDTRILIYCNNNFLEEPEAFTSKSPRASLNIYTFNTLYSYGYTNVYELAPLTDIRKSKLPFVGTRATELRKGTGSRIDVDLSTPIAFLKFPFERGYSSSSFAPFLYTSPRSLPSMNASISPSITP